MAYDLLHTFSTTTLQKPVVTGQSVDREGVLLRGVLDGGVEAVQKADGSANTYQLVGFAISDNQSISIMAQVETATIPASGTYTIQLSNSNLVGTGGGSTANQIYIIRNSTGVAFVQDNAAVTPTVSTANHYALTSTLASGGTLTGLITFNSADAGVAVTITYRYNLTVAQAQQRFFQRNINNQAGAVFNTVAVLTGVGEIWTYEYDASLAWTAGTAITSGADGILTQGGSGTTVPAHVIHVPDTTNSALGVAFSFRS
jgi:hypothetical protein